MSPNLVDALLAVVVLLSAWAGARRGFIFAMVQVVTLAASIAVAYLLCEPAARWATKELPELGVWARPGSLVVLFILSQVLLGALTHRLLVRVPPAVHRHFVNRTLGVLPGLVNGAINVLLVSMILLTAPLGEAVSDEARSSEIAQRMVEPAEWVEDRLTPVFEPAMRTVLPAVSQPGPAHASIDLHYTVSDARVRADLEAQMLELVNTERVRHHLEPLAPDPPMAEVARAHSRDMFVRGYFAHVSPQGQDLSQRVKQARLHYLVAGENLALARSLAAAHQGLMNSPGHRANILRPQFRRVGIGVLDGGLRGLMVTQDFRN